MRRARILLFLEARTTIITPSLSPARTPVSATASAGGVSMMTISYWCFTSWRNSRILLESKSSAGFGGLAPATYRVWVVSEEAPRMDRPEARDLRLQNPDLQTARLATRVGGDAESAETTAVAIESFLSSE